MDLTYQTNIPTGSGIVQKVRVGALTEGTTSNEQGVLNKPVILEYLEFATNSKTGVRLLIAPNAGANFVGGIAANGQSTITSMSPQNIVVSALGLFDVIEYNETNNQYKFRLRYPLTFPQGVSIKLENTGATSQFAGIMAIIKEC